MNVFKKIAIKLGLIKFEVTPKGQNFIVYLENYINGVDQPFNADFDRTIKKVESM